MLELQKKQIHMSRSKNTVSAQVTFDEDFNIPDAKPDVEDDYRISAEKDIHYSFIIR